MTFHECVIVCAGQPELVAQYDRLTGSRLASLATRAPIARMIDEATGAERDQVARFVAFIYDCVWMRGTWRKNQ